MDSNVPFWDPHYSRQDMMNFNPHPSGRQSLSEQFAWECMGLYIDEHGSAYRGTSHSDTKVTNTPIRYPRRNMHLDDYQIEPMTYPGVTQTRGFEIIDKNEVDDMIDETRNLTLESQDTDFEFVDEEEISELVHETENLSLRTNT